MKKFLITLMLLLIGAQSFAFYDKNVIQNTNQAGAEELFEPFAKMMAQTLNGGLGDVMNIGLFKVGVEMVAVPFEKEGFLADAPASFMPMPYVYGGASLFGITVFGRGMMLPMKSGGKTPALWGLGLGYELDLTPLITIEPAVTLHKTSNLDEMSITSWGFHLQGRLNLALLTIFGNVGASYTNYSTDIKLLGGSEKFEYDTTLLQTSIGAKITFFFVEVGFTPKMSYSFGFSIGF